MFNIVGIIGQLASRFILSKGKSSKKRYSNTIPSNVSNTENISDININIKGHVNGGVVIGGGDNKNLETNQK